MTPDLVALISVLAALVAYGLKLGFCLLVYRHKGDPDALAKAAQIGRFRS